MTESPPRPEQTADASLPGAVNPGQNMVLTEWETSAVYIMFQEELTTRTSISLSASQYELMSLFLIDPLGYRVVFLPACLISDCFKELASKSDIVMFHYDIPACVALAVCLSCLQRFLK